MYVIINSHSTQNNAYTVILQSRILTHLPFPAITHFRRLLLRIRWHVIQCFIYLFIDGIIININIIKLCHWISNSSANNIFFFNF